MTPSLPACPTSPSAAVRARLGLTLFDEWARESRCRRVSCSAARSFTCFDGAAPSPCTTEDDYALICA